MTVTREPRIGDIYWLRNCEPILGDVAKTRPVIVMTSPEAQRAIGGILAVACTSSAYPADATVIELPSHPLGTVRTGLRKKTWAVPEWAVMVRREQLVDYAGYISGPLFDRLLKAFLNHYSRDQKRGN